ncbi:MAG: hypothetical protein ABIJ47_10545, partial [Candidatus Bathyarchaeota archaeon]
MKNKALALTLLMMLLLAPLTHMVYAEETGEDPGSGNIDPLILAQIKQDTEARYQELYNLIFGQSSPPEGEGTEGEGTEGEEDPDLVGYDGPEIPEGTDPALRNQFMHAWMAMQQAQSMEGESPQAAAQQYLRAMKQLRNAWRKYQKDNPEVVEELTEESEGEPVEEGAEVPTEEEITEIQQQLINRFQERFQEQLTNMFSNYNEVQGDLSPGDAVKAQSALYHAEQKLLRIQERIQAGQYDEALDELDETTEGLDDEFNELEDPASAQMFRTMNQYEARIAKMVEKMERKTARGEDTSEEEDLVNQFRGNVNSAKNEHKENKGNGNGQGSNNGKGKPEDKG